MAVGWDAGQGNGHIGNLKLVTQGKRSSYTSLTCSPDCPPFIQLLAHVRSILPTSVCPVLPRQAPLPWLITGHHSGHSSARGHWSALHFMDEDMEAQVVEDSATSHRLQMAQMISSQALPGTKAPKSSCCGLHQSRLPQFQSLIVCATFGYVVSFIHSLK